jgi:hypothetical protein
LQEPPILENTTPSLAHKEVPLPKCASNCHTPLVNLLSRSSLSLSPSHTQSCDLFHFLEILALSLSSLSSLGTGFPTRDCGPLWWRCSLWVLHISLSLLRTWYFGFTHHISPQVRPHHGRWTIPNSSDSPLGCLLANLGPLGLTPDLKPRKLIFFCNQAWPQYPLENVSRWPLNGTFNPNI